MLHAAFPALHGPHLSEAAPVPKQRGGPCAYRVLISRLQSRRQNISDIPVSYAASRAGRGAMAERTAQAGAGQRGGIGHARLPAGRRRRHTVGARCV